MVVNAAMRLPILLLLCILTFCANGQQATKAPLRFQRYALNLNVNASEQLVITTRAGEVAIADQIDGYWINRNPGTSGNNYSGHTFDQANFFNNDTGIVSGYIQVGGKTNSIYHTSDRGKTWKVVDMGLDGWVDYAQNLDNGIAWLSVSGKGIAYTEDYGYNWKTLHIPDQKQRYTQIYFNDQKEGLIGSLWNSIAYTDDNCKNWRILPTPLDQKKYTKTNKESRPEIESVTIFKDWIFVNQEGLIFYSDKDSINWIWLKQFDKFYTDAVNSAFFVRNSRNEYFHLDSNLNAFQITKLTDITHSAQCRNGKLFIMSGDNIVKIDKKELLSSSPILTNQPALIQPEIIGYSRGHIIGAIGNKIYHQTEYNQTWNYLFDLPFKTDDGVMSMVDDDRIIYNSNSDTIVYYTIGSRAIEKRQKSNLLKEFSQSGIQKIYFSKGSRGCFHGYEDVITYQNNDYDFELENEEITGSGFRNGLRGYDDKIDGKLVKQFAMEISELQRNVGSLSDLAYTNKDFEKCKDDILAFEKSLGANKKQRQTSFQFQQNNLDFPRMLSLVDSLNTVDSAFLNDQLIPLDAFVSTTTNWIKIELLNNDGNIMSISSYRFPTTFNYPWIVAIDGYRFQTTNSKINKFITNAYPLLAGKTNRMELLYTLVKAMYRN